MSYLSEQNTDTPIDRWKFEETSGTTIADDIASTHNGTTNGTVTLNQLPQFVGSNLGANFDGTSAYVSFTNASGLLGIGTIEAVVQFTAVASTADIIFTHAFTGGILPLVLGTNLDGGHSGLLQIGYYTGSVWQTSTWSTAPSLNTPYHLVGTYNGTALTLYVNGSQVATSNPATARPGSGTIDNTGYIGRRWDLTQYHNGLIWDVALYSGALSSGRVTAHYNALANVFADNFANAGDLGVGGNITGVNTTGWTTEGSEPGSMSHTGWATFTPTSTRQYRVSTVGSNFDTLLAIYTGTALNNLVLVASDDNSGGSNTSLIEATLTSGTTYYVQVGAQPAGSGGTLSFSLAQAATSAVTAAYIEATSTPSTTARQLSAAYVDAATIPTLTSRQLSAAYIEGTTIPALSVRQVTAAYIEVLTPSVYSRPFVGWGVPL